VSPTKPNRKILLTPSEFLDQTTSFFLSPNRFPSSSAEPTRFLLSPNRIPSSSIQPARLFFSTELSSSHRTSSSPPRFKLLNRTTSFFFLPNQDLHFEVKLVEPGLLSSLNQDFTEPNRVQNRT